MLLSTIPMACILLAGPQAEPRPTLSEAPAIDIAAQSIEMGVELLLSMQESDPENAESPKCEWPYEGVYRVNGEIPIGYRVGGTAIACHALIVAAGYTDDPERTQAIHRATQFLCESIHHPLMAHEFESRYDVRGWGYTYGLDFLLRLKKRDLVPEGMDEKVEATIQFFLAGIAASEIPERGGWNYSRPRGFDAAGPHAPFMTAPTLLALFEAKAMGYEIDDAMVRRGVDALKRSRTATGSFMYGGGDGDRSRESVPGSVGRMLVSEIALYAAGESSPERVRGAIDAFLVHWEWLEKRRCQHGTHAPPYGIAPYYFFYAHLYAAQAVELLPEQERDEYRRRVRERIFAVRLEDGAWNDRVFPRSASYGTAMCMLALMAPDMPRPSTWSDASTQASD